MSSWLVIIIPAILCASMVPDQYKILNSGESYQYRSGRQFAIISGAILSLSAGLRYCVGTDYGNYCNMWWRYINSWKTDIFTFNEPGFSLLTKAASLVYNNYASMFFVVSILTVFFYVRTLYRYSPAFGSAIAIYILYGEWQHSFNGIKQYLAAAIVFAGYVYLKDRKLFRYIIVVLIASSFHISALVMIPVYFFCDRKVTLRNVALLVIIGVVISFSYERIFSVVGDIDASFSVNEYVLEGVKWQRVLLAFYPLALAYLIRHYFAYDSNLRYTFNIALVNAVIMVACMNSRYLTRFSYYTQIYAVLLLAQTFPKLGKNAKIYKLFTYLIYTVFWVIETTTGFYWIFNR